MATAIGLAQRLVRRATHPVASASVAASTKYDYVVVGAGSAGCALASRLSEDPSVRVLLLEAGGRDWSPWIHIPVGYFRNIHNPNTDWMYKVEAESSGLAGRSISWPRGKVLGGSSSINGLLYIRGHSSDYDNWATKLGLDGWSYDDVLPHFKRAFAQERGSDAWHGDDGPVSVQDARLSRSVCDDFLAAAREAGVPGDRADGLHDFNGETQEGAGYFQVTTKNSMRCSAAVGYLDPARDRPNLHIVTNALAHRVVLSDDAIDLAAAGAGAAPRSGAPPPALAATGLEFSVRGERHVARVAVGGEVLLSAGAIGSPQLMQLSGLGSADVLGRAGVELRHSLPGVGRNLHDHLQVRSVYKTRPGVLTLNDEVSSWPRKGLAGAQYMLRGTGPLSMAASVACVFAKTKVCTGDAPDVQFHFQPLSATTSQVGGASLDPFSAVTSSVCQLRPKSRGTVEIASADPAAHPKLHANYLSHEDDQRCVVEAMRLSRRICRDSPRMAASVASELVPGAGVGDDFDALLQHARQVGESIYHPAGTCAMGRSLRDAPGSVVDASLRVHGVAGLRVADCSVMPEIVSGNTNAPTIMIGEKLAHDILRDRRAAAAAAAAAPAA